MIELLITVTGFAALICFTPGPANILIITHAASHGFRYTVPLIAGILTGYAAVGLSLSFGLGALFQQYPSLKIGLTLLGSAYLLYLAYRLYTAKVVGLASDVADIDRLRYRHGLPIHPLSPKAWLGLLSAMAQFSTPEQSISDNILFIALPFVFTGILSAITWSMVGSQARHWLSPHLLKRFNQSMSILLALLVLWLLWMGLTQPITSTT